MTSGRNTITPDGCTLIFWGTYFDEGVAITFATTLREMGNCVKVVGLNGQYATGRNGVTLQSDISVTDLPPLLDQIRCIIFPCYHAASSIRNDLRLSQFFAEVAKRAAMFIVAPNCELLRPLLPTTTYENCVLNYPAKETLLDFAGMIGRRLAGNQPSAMEPRDLSFALASPTYTI